MTLIEKLRQPRRVAPDGSQVGECYGCYDNDRYDAAAEIERLKTALVEMTAQRDKFREIAEGALSLADPGTIFISLKPSDD